MRAARFIALCAVSLTLAVGAAIALAPRDHQSTPRRYASMTVPEARVFERACKDCHSNDTEWPWYSRVPPISLGVVADVRRGRKAWNISEWGHYSKGRKTGFLTAVAVDAARDNMPPLAYRWMHRGSTLSNEDRALLISWSNRERQMLRTMPSVATSAKIVSR